MKAAVLLSGSGVYDGSEIHETVLTLLALDEKKVEYFCFAPNIDQHHVINHVTGESVDEVRNVLIESARIARGNIKDIAVVSVDDFDILVIPGGFGAAKNLTKWAFDGPNGDINSEVKRIINESISSKKPIAAMCMGPTVVAKALEGSGLAARLTVGTTEEASPYDIAAVSAGMDTAGAVSTMRTVREIEHDDVLKIVSAPCYMMEASISDINKNIKLLIDEVVTMAK